MEIPAEQIIDGLLEEIKRLTFENILLKASLNESRENKDAS